MGRRTLSRLGWLISNQWGGRGKSATENPLHPPLQYHPGAELDEETSSAHTGTTKEIHRI